MRQDTYHSSKGMSALIVSDDATMTRPCLWPDALDTNHLCCVAQLVYMYVRGYMCTGVRVHFAQWHAWGSIGLWCAAA